MLYLQDFYFILKGITRLLNNPLTQTYLPGSCKKIQFHQELLVLFWKMCDINKVRHTNPNIRTGMIHIHTPYVIDTVLELYHNN